jgi:hypothetical protein
MHQWLERAWLERWTWVQIINYVVSEPFVEVSWEKAEKLVADELNRVKRNLVTPLYMEDHMGGLVLADFIMLKVNFIDF